MLNRAYIDVYDNGVDMKILWVCNVVLPIIGESIGLEQNVFGGWMTGLLDEVKKKDDTRMVICFPCEKEKIRGKVENIEYYAFLQKDILKYSEQNEKLFIEILKNEKPDVVHIWGTEFPHTLAMVNACDTCGMLDRMVVSIQGLISLYGNKTDHYFAGLPECVTRKSTLRDFIKQDNIWKQREKFTIRGKFEIQALKKTKHVIGRTEWDRACVLRVNPSLHYHFCDENLRDTFYHEKWSYESCEKHSIFVSQCSYPLKGFHRILDVMKQIIEEYPDVHLYTTGEDILDRKGLLMEQRETYYQIYLKNQIIQYGLQNHISFCGRLSAEQMKERMLKTNIFVSPSSIENSSNSLGEAMLLGVPCISSQVGGIRSLVTHGYDGLLYPFDETYLLEYYIKQIFQNEKLAKRLSSNAYVTAHKRHDIKKNTDTMVRIYERLNQRRS